MQMNGHEDTSRFDETGLFQFFGIKNCLSLWDELRRIKERPQEPRLRELWRLACGGDAQGSITAEQQRGDALAF